MFQPYIHGSVPFNLTAEAIIDLLPDQDVIYFGKHGVDTDDGLNIESAMLTASAAITAAAAGRPRATPGLRQAPPLLDHWAAESEREDASQENGFSTPTLEWLDLFAEGAEILSICQAADSSGALPNE